MAGITGDVRRATEEEVTAFVNENRQSIGAEGEAFVRKLYPSDQYRIIRGGSMQWVVNNSAEAVNEMRMRVIKAREREGKGSKDLLEHPEGDAAILKGALTLQASEEDVEHFIMMHRLGEEAQETLRRLTPVEQKHVIRAGGFREDCTNPSAVMMSRCRLGREMEQELEKLAYKAVYKQEGRPLKEETKQVPSLKFDPGTSLTDVFGGPALVKASERRFATPAGTTPAVVEQESEAPPLLEGTVCGVGGVIEVPKAKYGCTAGQRLRVVGQKANLWQCEGGITINRFHEKNGWHWVLRKSQAEILAEEAAQKKRQAKKEKEDACMDNSQDQAEGNEEDATVLKKESKSRERAEVVQEESDNSEGKSKRQEDVKKGQKELSLSCSRSRGRSRSRRKGRRKGESLTSGSNSRSPGAKVRESNRGRKGQKDRQQSRSRTRRLPPKGRKRKGLDSSPELQSKSRSRQKRRKRKRGASDSSSDAERSQSPQRSAQASRRKRRKTSRRGSDSVSL